jgi:hypothetical protein
VEGSDVAEISLVRAEIATTARSSFFLSQVVLTALFLPVDIITGADILGKVSFGTQTVVGASEALSDIFFEANSPAYTWLTITVPTDAMFLSFDLETVGLTQSDFFGVAIDGTEMITVYGDQVEDGVPYFTGLINVSQWAGMQVELFMGLESDGANDQSVHIQNLIIYSVPEPDGFQLASGFVTSLFVSMLFRRSHIHRLNAQQFQRASALSVG